MPITKTKLTKDQRLRLINSLDHNSRVVNAQLVKVDETPITLIEYQTNSKGKYLKYYPDDETLNFILNGMKLERESA